MYYIYILKSLKDNKLYIGQTSDLQKRISEHNSGLVKSTRYRMPLKLIYKEVYKTRSEAFKRERELKLLSAGKFKKKLLGL